MFWWIVLVVILVLGGLAWWSSSHRGRGVDEAGVQRRIGHIVERNDTDEGRGRGSGWWG